MKKERKKKVNAQRRVEPIIINIVINAINIIITCYALKA